MKKVFSVIFALFLISVFCGHKTYAYMVKYKEDYYKLFHVHYQQYPDDVMENIYWLEQAVKADFCNPLYANAKIDDETQWEKYRYLFMMHLNLKLIEQHLRLGRVYDRKSVKFYDAPWKEIYIENLNKTLSCYQAGLYYWQEAKLWAEKANVKKFQFLTLTDLQNWEDERERIGNGRLDYEKILNREIQRVKNNIAEYEEMTEETY